MSMNKHRDTVRSIDQLQIDLDRIEKVPPFRKLEAARCALDSAMAVLRLLNARIATLEKDFGE